MTRYREGDWVQYRTTSGYVKKKMVLAVRPDGNLVLGDHEHDSDNRIIDPEYDDSLQKL